MTTSRFVTYSVYFEPILLTSGTLLGRMGRGWSLGAIVLAASVIFAAGARGQTDYEQPDETLPGFKSNNVYHDLGSVDHVNIYSGDTGIVIPLGPSYPLGPGTSWQLKAYHTEKMWTYDAHCTTGGAPLGHGVITGYPTLGAGWTLDVGHVASTKNGVWFYQSPDGGRHSFNIGPLATATQYFSWDSTQLRVTWYPAANYFTVEFPDGSTQYFEHLYARPGPTNGDPSQDFNDRYYGSPPDTRWGLTRYKDRFGTLLLQVNYVGATFQIGSIVLTPNDHARTVNFNWTTYAVTNSGPSITNTQSLTLSPVWPVLQSIAFPAASGGTLTATFSFIPGTFRRSGYSDGVTSTTCAADSSTPAFVAVPMLWSIAITGSLVNESWTFTYNAMYSSPWPFGALLAVQLPTGGRIEYAYGPTAYDCNIPGCSGPTNAATSMPNISSGGRPDLFNFTDASPAVVSRTEKNADGSTSSQIRYERKDYWLSLSPTNYSTTQTVREVIVHRPDGNGNVIADRYLFHVFLSKSLVSTDTTGGLELVHYYYDQDLPSSPSPIPIRTVVSCYDSDSVTGACGYAKGTAYDQSTITAHTGSNSRLQKRVTWYGDKPVEDAAQNAVTGGDCGQATSPACWQSESSDYNAVAGEYRIETKSSPYWAEAFGERYWQSRTTTTNWTATGNPTKWLLKLFDDRTVTDTYSNGCPFPPCARKTNYTFTSSNGFLERVQTVDPDPASTYGSITHSFTSDGSGNPGKEVLSSLGNVFDSGIQFTTYRNFQNGFPTMRKESGICWKAFDVDRDAATGVITTSRDPNGLATSYSYDALGRLIQVSPPGGEASSTYCYVVASGSTGPYILAKKGASGSCSTTDAAPGWGSGPFEAYFFDGFGRPIREIHRQPNTLNTGSYFSFRQTTYNSAGLPSFVSEWTPCPTASLNVTDCLSEVATRGTTYEDYDFLSRARHIRAADSTTTTKEFSDLWVLGDRRIYNNDVTEIVTLSDVGGRQVWSATRKDLLGRMTAGLYPVVVNGAVDRAHDHGQAFFYDHNTLDKLVNVLLPDDQDGNSQARSFSYDVLGLLKSEIQPETGTTTYKTYDARREARSWTANNNVTYTATFDAAGRQTELWAGSQQYLRNVFDSGKSGMDCTVGAGSNVFGRLTQRTGFNAGLDDWPRVIEDFLYSDPTGRLSQKTTTVNTTGGSPPLAVTERWVYNPLGLIHSHFHPRRSGDAPFTVSTGYKSGQPVFVTANGIPVVTSATYQPHGALASYATGNGTGRDVTTTIWADPVGMPRPSQIFTSGANSSFNTGTIYYDGAGNVLTMGSDTFGYDPLSRLTSASLSGAGSQTFSYDVFGNLTVRSGGPNPLSLGIVTATNRINGYTYDPLGNLTNPPGETIAYDALSQATTATGPGNTLRYAYTGSGERVLKVSSLAGSTFTFRDGDNRVATEYAGTVASRDNVFLGNLLVGSYSNSAVSGNGPSWVYYSSDHLGTPRLLTDNMGATVESRRSRPFGEDVSTSQPFQRLRYATMERDPEGQRYYDHARSHSFGLARFLSPDKLGGKIEDPQSWNRYTYTRNNPLKNIDPNGQETVTVLPDVYQRLGTPESEEAANVAFGAAAVGVTAPILGAAAVPMAFSVPGLTASVFRIASIAERGRQVEAALAAAFGGALNRSFPVIDRFMNGVATSVKSVDLLAKSYQDPGRLSSLLTGFVDKLATFTGKTFAGQSVGAADITRRVLELVVEEGVASPTQIQAIQKASQYAQTAGVELRVIVAR